MTVTITGQGIAYAMVVVGMAMMVIGLCLDLRHRRKKTKEQTDDR